MNRETLTSDIPRYLRGYEALWRANPRQANRAWFRDARFGLFIHYGLYSLLGDGEWVQYQRKIPVAEYAKLKERFTAKKFDADFITDLALEAGMRYVNLVTCHHESFCLWNSRVEPFNSVQSPCGRDLVRELAAQCDRKGLGFFAYYTFMINWRHPYFLTTEHFQFARPHYDQPQPEYKLRSLANYPRYVEYMLACLRELLELEYPVAGIWLDIISAYFVNPALVPLRETYDLIRRLRPETLISYKQGATGEEDFATPEHSFESLGVRLRQQGLTAAAVHADRIWEINRPKHNEICTTLQDRGWGYNAAARHLSPGEVWAKLSHAGQHNANLLANVGPLPDGSIAEEDIRTLREVGRRIRTHGWPVSPSSSVPLAGLTGDSVTAQ